MSKTDKVRMIHWIMFAAVFYILAAMAHHPQLQTGLWKAGHITSGAFMGYWIDRNLFDRVTGESVGSRLIARAVIVAAAVVGMAFGL
jgi:hypothetical protein